MAKAFNLISFGNPLMGKENLDKSKRKCPKRPHYSLQIKGSTLGNIVISFIAIGGESDENNSKIE
jgi:hypothetical protein